jgi:hypothetical protein
MRIYFLLLLSIVFFSCKTKDKPSFEKVWFYNDEFANEDVFRYGASPEYGFSSASFMNLKPDGKFTSYLTAFDYGDWVLRDSTLILTNHNKGKLVLDVKKLSVNQMLCVNKNSHKLYPFNGFPNAVSSEAESPFSIRNNMWRVKANHKESNAEIQSRLKNHFKWWEKYFSWGLANKIQVLDVRSTASILNMYANGFELKYYDTQFPEWKNIFYDTTDCWKAYEMVYYLMYKKNINWPKTENRFESFVSAFKQLQQWMDIDPKTYLPAKETSIQTVSRKELGKTSTK